MLLYAEKLTDVPILSLQTGSPLAHTSEPIIDPRRLLVVAFYCKGPMLDTDPTILHTTDIREFSDIGIIINGSDNLMSPDGLVRLQEVIGFRFDLIGMKVVDDHGQKLGKVINYISETADYLVQKLVVKRPLLKSLHDTELIIDRRQIVEIIADRIIVKAPSIQEPAAKSDQRQPIVNPFRKSEPQIDSLQKTTPPPSPEEQS